MNKKKEANLPKWTQWFKLLIDSIILITSIIAIYFTYSTLNEVKTQRIKSYEPELRLFREDFKMNCIIRNFSNAQSSSDFSIYTYSNKFDSTAFLHVSGTKDAFIPWYKCNNFKMPVINVGQSAALDVETTFVIDTAYFLDFFNHFLYSIDKADKLIAQNNRFSIVRFTDTIPFIDFVKPSNKFQYIPQYNSNKDTFFIYLPITYFKLLAMRSILCSANSNETYKGISVSDHHNNMPLITVRFKYKDINGIEYFSSSNCYFNGLGIGITGNKIVDYNGDMDVKFIKKETNYND